MHRSAVRAIFIVLLWAVSASAQLRVEFVDTIPLNGLKYPLLTARVKATLNGLPFVLTTSNVLIQEDVVVSVPSAVSDNSSGIQTVSWYTRNRNVKGGSATIVIFSATQTASASADTSLGLGIDSRTPQLRFTDSRNRRIKELAFGNTPAGTTATRTVFCVPTSGRFDAERNEERVFVDSIRTTTPYFKPIWRGGLGAWSLPGKMSSPLDYPVAVEFTPPDGKYYQDILTVYYEGGAVEQLALIGNSFVLPTRTVLNITSPNGSEMLAPCQTVNVQWTGASVGSTTIVEASFDGGVKWQEIGRSKDSSLQWTVPDTPTNDAVLRVRAELDNQTNEQLSGTNTAACDKLTFSPNSSTLLSCYRNGQCQEWNMQSFASAASYTLRTSGNLGTGMQSFGCGYTSDTTFFVAYRNTTAGAVSDTLVFFRVGIGLPLRVVALGSDVRYKGAFLDSSRSTIILVPRSGTVVKLLSAANGAEQKVLPMPAPVRAFSIAKDRAAIALLDGQIVLYSTQTWTQLQSVRCPTVPVIEQVMLLPDNQRLVIGCQVNEPSTNEASFSDAYVVDIASQQIIRAMRKAATAPVAVSANSTSRYVLFGYVAQPQGPLWDISPNQVYGSVLGHGGSLTDVAFSPSGTLLASSAVASDNLRVRSFVYPEIDYTDASFSIQRPVLSVIPLAVNSMYAFTSADTVITLNVCNTGKVQAVVTAAQFAQSFNFRLLNTVLPDTIMPGECMSLRVRTYPVDTGKLRDDIRLQLCALAVSLPVEVYSIPRNLGGIDTVNMGDRCPNAPLDTIVTVITNNDPVPVVIDESFLSDQTDSWYTVLSAERGDTLLPGESYRVRIRYTPTKIGVQDKVLLVFYGNQRRYVARIVLHGRGIGSEVQVRPRVVGFIPEVRERLVTLTNSNANEVSITDLNVTPAGAFSIDAISLPRVIPPGDSLVVKVYWTDTSVSQGSLQTSIAPCSAPVTVPLQRYSGTASLRFGAVNADPRGRARIPVLLKVAENFAFAEERTLEAEFSVNPRMFLADSVQSVIGRASIIRQEIVDDERRITLRVEANFPYADTVAAVVHGVAGLAETDVSPLKWMASSSFFGSSVRVTTTNGEMRLTNLCGSRRIVQSGGVSITAIDPQPAESDAQIRYTVEEDGPVTCRVFTNAGELLYTEQLQAVTGENLAHLSCSALSAGTYTVQLHSARGASSTLLMVMR
jgi:WD40 repeat protein